MKYFRFSRLSRRWRWWLGICAVLGPVFWLHSSLLFVYVMTRRPHVRFAEPAPDVAWATFEEHQLTTSDGHTLGAWFCRRPANGPCVILLHGNRGCRHDVLPAAEFFAKEGCAVLLVSLRAHGDSTGESNDFGYSARRDVIAAVEFLEKKRPGRPIVIKGISMGAAAAIFASAELGERVSGYILESPYRDLHQAVRNRTSMFLPPILDRVAYIGLALAGRVILPDADRIAPIEYVQGIPPSVPALFLSGTKDKRARSWEAQALCDRIADHAHLALFEGAGHGNLFLADPHRYAEVVTPLLHKVGSGRLE
jgi:alpha-beta hydrolase superfamily lysophospholipase